MPLRPALKTIHPLPPQPTQVRPVACPHCHKRFEVSQRAMSARCPFCTKPLEFNDMTLRARLEGDIATMGHVELSQESDMLGRLVCGQFTNGGRFEGRAVVYGAVVLGEQSRTAGEVFGRSLRVELGATTYIKARITLKPVVSTNVPSPIGKLVRRPSRRLVRPSG